MFWRLLLFTKLYIVFFTVLLPLKVFALNIPNFKSTDMIIPVHDSCHYWRHYCYDHDGVFESDYHRCLRRRGCRDATHSPAIRHFHYHPPRRSRRVNRCRSFRRRCAREWGRRTRDYYGCLKYHGCAYRRGRHRYY